MTRPAAAAVALALAPALCWAGGSARAATAPPSSTPRAAQATNAPQASPSGAPQPPGPPQSFANVAGFDRITTDSVQWNLNSGAFTIKDRFTAERSGTTITGDRATGNSKQRTFEAVGHVVVHQTAPLHGTSNEQNLSERPSTLYCDKLDVDGPRQIYSAYGNVHFVQEGGREATADQGTLNDKAHQLHMQGNVQIRDGERTLDAGLVDYNTLTGDLQAQSNVTITAPVATPTPGPPRPTPTPKVRRHR